MAKDFETRYFVNLPDGLVLETTYWILHYDRRPSLLNDHLAKVKLSPKLHELVEGRAIRGGIDAWSVAATWSFIESILARVDDAKPEAQPELFAAKVLLGLAGSDDPQGLVPGRFGMTLEQLKEKYSELKTRSLAKNVTARKAYVVGLFGADDLTNLNVEGRITHLISEAFAERIFEELARDDLDLSHFVRPDPSPVGRAPTRSPTLGRLMARAVARLDRPLNSEYPAHLTARILADGMQVIQTSPEENLPGGAREEIPLGPATRLEPHLLLVGPPGAGKSTVASALLAWHLEAGVGMWARATHLVSVALDRPHLETRDLLVEAFQLWLGEVLSVPESGALTEVLSDESTLVVVDGLDEVTDPIALEVMGRVLHDLESSSAMLILTSRPGGPSVVPARWARWELQPLADAKVESFIAAWFGDSSEASSRTRIYLNHALDVGRLPLMLGFLAMLPNGAKPPENEAELFDACIDLLLMRVWKPLEVQRNDDFSIGSVRGVVERLAWSLAKSPTASGSDWRGASDGASAAELVRLSGDAQVARELVRLDGLLVAERTVHPNALPTAQTYRWLHRSFQEHLIASFLSAEILREPQGAQELVFELLLRRRTWFEPIRRAVQMLPLKNQVSLADFLVHRLADRDELRPAWLRVLEILHDRQTSPELRGRLVASLGEQASFSLLLQLAPKRADEVIESGRSRPSRMLDLLKQHDEEFGDLHRVAPPSSWLREQIGANPENIRWILETLAWADLDAAALAAIELLDAGRRQRYFHWPSRSYASVETKSLIAERIRTAAFPQSLSYAALLLATDQDRQYSKPMLRTDPRIVLAQIAWTPDWVARSLREGLDQNFLTRSWSSPEVPWIASAAGAIGRERTLSDRNSTPVARVSARLAMLRTQLGRSSRSQDAKAGPLWSTNSGGRSTTGLVAASGALDLENIDSVDALISAIEAEAYRGVDGSQLHDYVQAITLVEAVGPLTSDSTVDPLFLLDVLNRLVSGAAQRCSWTDVFSAFEPFLSSSAQARESLQDILGDAWSGAVRFSHPVGTSNKLAELAAIYQRHDVALLWRIRNWEYPALEEAGVIKGLQRLKSERADSVWRVPQNLRAVAAWFDQAGLLSELA